MYPNLLFIYIINVWCYYTIFFNIEVSNMIYFRAFDNTCFVKPWYTFWIRSTLLLFNLMCVIQRIMYIQFYDFLILSWLVLFVSNALLCLT